MARDFAKKFYNSSQWQTVRDEVIRKRRLCERCLKRGVVTAGSTVHHRVWLTPDNIDDPAISLNEKNLELLCDSCHKAEHNPKRRRYRLDSSGNVIPRR